MIQCVEVQAVRMHGTHKGIVPFFSVTCSDLTVPTNGVINYHPDTTPRLEGTVATQSCDDGYEPLGGTERTCQSDRTWSGGVITCIGELRSSLDRNP